MAAAIYSSDANANSASGANRSGPEAFGTIGAIGTEVLGEKTAASGQLSALLAQSAQSVAVVPPCPATVTERAALIEEGDGCDRAEADRRALAEFGLASWHELAAAHAAAIRAELDRLPAPTSHDGRRLEMLTRDFLGTEHWQRAVECGWPLLELFGVHRWAPTIRVEGWGLVTTFALTRLVGPRLECITPEAAIIRYRSGSRLSHRVGRPGMCSSLLWWECAALIGEAAA